MRRILIVILAVIGLMFMSGPVQADLSDGLVAYYPFNGDANDESGNGNDGTVNGATLTTDRFGNADSAYSFNGSDDYISADGDGSLAINENFSLSTFIYADEVTSATQFLLVRRGGTKDYYKLTLKLDKINFKTESGPVPAMASDLAIEISNWYHVCAVYDGSSARIYINGQLSAEEIASGNLSTSSANLYIGCNTPSGTDDRWFDGKIDDVRIYNRALSETEIQQLYWGGGTTGCTQTELDEQYQAGYTAGKAATGGASASITINPDLSFNLPSAVYTNPLTGSMDLDLTFEYFGQEGTDLLWKLGTMNQN